MSGPSDDYGGLIAVAENAKRDGYPIHVATRVTCQEHIVAGDDQREDFSFGQVPFDELRAAYLAVPAGEPSTEHLLASLPRLFDAVRAVLGEPGHVAPLPERKRVA
jgi:hypothetical protein